MTDLIKPTPWDTAIFNMPTWEECEYSPAALRLASQTTGHHTIKVDPLADKRLLHDYGYYYCDTLIEPYCNASRLRPVRHVDATINQEVDASRALEICHGAFSHGRFLRDFNLTKEASDLRYDNWLKQMLATRRVYGLYWRGELAGFIGHEDSNLLLHAVAESFRGKGYAKYWWSEVCVALLALGHEEVKSSISAANLAVLKLYSTLGFSFRKPQDVYHKIIA